MLQRSKACVVLPSSFHCNAAFHCLGMYDTNGVVIDARE
jgi:hypothetical protein